MISPQFQVSFCSWVVWPLRTSLTEMGRRTFRLVLLGLSFSSWFACPWFLLDQSHQWSCTLPTVRFAPFWQVGRLSCQRQRCNCSTAKCCKLALRITWPLFRLVSTWFVLEKAKSPICHQFVHTKWQWIFQEIRKWLCERWLALKIRFSEDE